MKLLAPASRSKPVLTLSANSGSVDPTVTVTLASLRTLAAGKSFYYYSTTLTHKLTVAAFDTNYTAAGSTVKGTITTTGAGVSLGTPTVTSAAVYVKVVDDLGNATVIKSSGVFSLT
jgi:hypothetical protein